MNSKSDMSMGTINNFLEIVFALSRVYLVPQEEQKRDLQVKGTYK